MSDLLNKGDRIMVHIKGLGSKGDGFAKYRGMVVFVPNAKEGEEVNVEITKVLPTLAFGRIIE